MKRPFSILEIRPNERPKLRTFASDTAAFKAAKAAAVALGDSVCVYMKNQRGNENYVGMCHKNGACTGWGGTDILPAWLER